jgi:drug/metabolite transporter (DMT)-like permease
MSSFRIALWQLHIAVFLAGFTAILGRVIELEESSIVWYRLLFSAVILFLYLLFIKDSLKVSPRNILSCFGVGSLIGLHWLFFYASIKAGNASIALVCFSATGSFTAILEPIITRRKFDWREILTGLFVLVGIGLIFQFDTRYREAIILGLTAALFSAIFPVYTKKLLTKLSVPVLSFYVLTGGLLFLTLFLPVYTGNLFFLNLPSLNDLIWLVLLALFCTVIAFQFSFKALKRLSAFTINLTFNLEPLYGMLMAFVFFQEHKELSLSFYIGTAILLISVGVETYMVRRKERAKKDVVGF